jgi:hypothetical protein
MARVQKQARPWANGKMAGSIIHNVSASDSIYQITAHLLRLIEFMFASG